MRRLACALTVLVLSVLICVPAFALDPSTLHNGSRGDEVRRLQQALIALGFLKDQADGIFGNRTEDAVRRFQQANRLTADGLAGKMTQSVLYAEEKTGSPAGSSPAADSAGQTESAPAAAVSVEAAAVSPSSGSLFSGNYATLRKGASGSRVKILQQALLDLGYSVGKADGKFGNQTLAAVIAFQKQQSLVQDGAAGKKTLTALEKAFRNGSKSASALLPAESAAAEPASASEPPAASSSVTVASVSAPDVGSIRLLHWFNDIKPTLKNGQNLLVYDPASGLSWTLRILARGRHCDCEPLTQADTDTMYKAFGNQNTWNQKGVYVRLPGGAWTVGSTHNMPHMSGSIKDNGFDGHLCVHFLRNMDEAKAMDPNYGVANQETIRALWKKISGADIAY